MVFDLAGVPVMRIFLPYSKLRATAEVSQLAAGGALGIFPEGKSHDAMQLALVRSGAVDIVVVDDAHGVGLDRVGDGDRGGVVEGVSGQALGV